VDISIVVCCHNSAGRLPLLFAAFRGLKIGGLAVEWVLVDNASNDGTPDLLRSLAEPLPGSKLYVTEPRLGQVYAHISGVGATSGGLVVSFDDDNLPETDFLLTAAEIFATRPTLIGLGGSCLPAAGGLPEWVRPVQSLLALRDFPEEAFFPFGRLAGPRHPWGAGLVLAGAAARRAIRALESLELPRLGRRGEEFGGGEDTTLCFLAAGPDGLVGYSPRLRLVHDLDANRLEPAYLCRLALGVGLSGLYVADVMQPEGRHRGGVRARHRLHILAAILRDAARALFLRDKGAIVLLQMRVTQLLDLQRRERQ
jgi:glycosyltransferase involved in cell wall biosynthesis